MRILFVNWKDWKHPKSGGAEVVLREICKRLVQNDHQVSLLTAIYPLSPNQIKQSQNSKTDNQISKQNKESLEKPKNQKTKKTLFCKSKISLANSDSKKMELSAKYDNLDGVSIIRTGQNKFLHSLFANFYYQKNLVREFDLVVEMVNTAPYFLGFNNSWNNFWQNLKPFSSFKTSPKPETETRSAAKFENLEPKIILQKEKSQNITFYNLEDKNLKKSNEIIIQNLEENLAQNLNQKSDSNKALEKSQTETKKLTRFALFYHQLAREIWWLETTFPINFIGFYFLEPVATWLQSHLNCQTITISNSSKNDLVRFGFDRSKIKIISEGIDNLPLENLQKQLPKEPIFTILYHGSLRPMKRPMEVLESFNKFKKLLENQQKKPQNLLENKSGAEQNSKKITSDNSAINEIETNNLNTDLSQLDSQNKNPFLDKKEKKIFQKDLIKTSNSNENKSKSGDSKIISCQLWISGSGEEMEKCQNFCSQQKITDLVKFWGRTSDELKLELMQKSHLGLATSIKEGWGLIVTETNSMGTPCVVYDVDGLRDSGSLSGNFVVLDSDEMAWKILEIYNLWKAENDQKLELDQQHNSKNDLKNIKNKNNLQKKNELPIFNKYLQNQKSRKAAKLKSIQFLRTKKSNKKDYKISNLENHDSLLEKSNNSTLESSNFSYTNKGQSLEYKYTQICQNALDSSKKITFENCYQDFCKIFDIK